MTKERKRMSNKAFNIMWSVILILIAALLIAANWVTSYWAPVISLYLGTATSKVVNTSSDDQTDADTEYYEYDYDVDDSEALFADSKELVDDIAEEGIVLLQNDNEALPLEEGAKVSLFSIGSVSPITGGTGSGATDSDVMSTKEAMGQAGLSVNETLWDFYTDKYNSGYTRTYTGVWSSDPWAINEVPVSEFTSDVEDSLSDYSDAAIVFICREGGENEDLPDNDGSETSTGSVTDSTEPYLTLNETETELIQYLQDSPYVEKIIIVCNMNNAFELGWTENYSKIQATIFCGGSGDNGMEALAKVIVGEVNPSGRLVDTYAYDSLSAPATQNMGDYTYSNSEDLTESDGIYLGTHYVVYAEGIYVGYRYYETRYEDVVMGTGNAGDYDYATQVQYAFGYGLSYTEFEYSDFQFSYTDDGFTVTLTVTNTGDVAGKEVVELYFQSPYTDYDKTYEIEKASVELCGYAKTQTLEPGKSETVTINVDIEELRTYDSYNAEGYILDAGDYYFSVGTDAHDALNNILAAKGYTVADGMTADGNTALVASWTNDALDTEIFKTSLTYSGEEGAEITNQFEYADLNNYGYDITYLSRSDWTGTFPSDDTTLEANEQLIQAMVDNSTGSLAVEDDSYEMPTTAAGNGLTLADMIGLDYDDELWDSLLDNLTGTEMMTLVAVGSFGTQAVESIAAPATTAQDGPAGVNASSVGGAMASATAFPVEVVLASTWNDELVIEYGDQLAEECHACDVQGLYGPGGGIHRSPYSGRNYEYYSEDSYLSYHMCAIETEAINAKGIITYVKHFALNDTEKNRQGVSTWANEQSIREIYLSAFEGAVRGGGTTAVMSSYNRIGPVWTGASTELMNNVLRDEWGFEGMSLTDFVNTTEYQSHIAGLTGGNDLWLNTSTAFQLDYSKNAYVLTLLRNACHNILYAVANSSAMNGISKTTEIVEITPSWQIALYILDGVVVIGEAAAIVLIVRRNKRYKAQAHVIESEVEV